MAAPRVLALNNEPALVRTAAEAPTARPGQRPALGGVTLEVTPQISANNVVTLSLSPIVTLQDADSGNGAPAVTAIRETDTLARVADGETLVLGGFTRQRETRERQNAGISGGWFGRSTVVTRKRIELVILLTPRILRADRSSVMYEQYYGFTEKPFSLTPDPKYLYRSQSHANAFELLQYAIRRREGFVVVTGDIGTGKTTLCRALLEQIDQTTFTALVLNPFLSEEDLLKRILQDFGVISRDDVKAGRLAGVSKQELIDTLYDFLLGLIPLKASAVLIIDEAQNLPLHVLEQIRILSNLETDKEKLLQIILVGQLNLHGLLRSARAASARSAHLDPLPAEAARRGGGGRVCPASFDDRGRGGIGRVQLAGACAASTRSPPASRVSST